MFPLAPLFISTAYLPARAYVPIAPPREPFNNLRNAHLPSSLSYNSRLDVASWKSPKQPFAAPSGARFAPNSDSLRRATRCNYPRRFLPACPALSCLASLTCLPTYLPCRTRAHMCMRVCMYTCVCTLCARVHTRRCLRAGTTELEQVTFAAAASYTLFQSSRTRARSIHKPMETCAERADRRDTHVRAARGEPIYGRETCIGVNERANRANVYRWCHRGVATCVCRHRCHRYHRRRRCRCPFLSSPGSR